MYATLLVAMTIVAAISLGCAAPTDPPPHETAGPALEQAGVLKPAFNNPKTKPKKAELTPEQKAAAEEANMERQIRSMAHYAAATAHRERGEEQEALNEYYQSALADPSNDSAST